MGIEGMNSMQGLGESAIMARDTVTLLPGMQDEYYLINKRRLHG